MLEKIAKERKRRKIKLKLKELIKEKGRAFKNNVKSFEVSIVSRRDQDKQLYYTKTAKVLEKQLKIKKGLKAYVTIHIEFKKKKIKDGEVYFEFKNAHFNSKAFTIKNSDQTIDALDQASEEVLNGVAVWLSGGSGWTIEEILGHYINIVKYVPFRGRSYMPLPEKLSNSKKGLINLKNEDNKCFLWCHVRHLNPQKKDPQRIKLSERESAKDLDHKGITFPVTIKQIPQIERQNKININVFGYDEKDGIFPIRNSTEKYDDYMDLLYLEGKEGKTHYVLIKDFNRLNYQFSKMKCKKHFCKHCPQCFYSEGDLENHREDCVVTNGSQAIELPKPYIDRHGVERIPSVYFKNHHKGLPRPFVIIADFECLTEKMSRCTPSDEKSYTEKYQKHTPCSFGYKGVCRYDKKYSKDLVIYRGEDLIGEFLKCMQGEVQNCQEVIKNHFNKPLKMSQRDESNFRKATRCHICQKKYRDNDGPNEKPIRDHCHVTGKYRGSAHLKCNLKLQISAEKLKIPVVFHNLRGYDSHFIIQKLAELAKEEQIPKIDVIPNNSEQYMAFYLGKHLVFLDSFQFMNKSLDKLAEYLSENEFIYTKEHFTDERQFRLMTEKGVYPYDYMDSSEKFNDTQLPKREDFYSLLKDEDISDDKYNHAKEVWDIFGIKNMGEYHDLYLKSDILLLADVIENFRETCLEYYGLDPVHYVSSPGLAWDATLKMNGISLELITDIDQQLFIEKGMRGGISYIAHRHAKANNKYMKFYNPEDRKTYIIYLDANNLYGWAMIQRLPYGGFRWVEPKYYAEKEEGIGYIYEVDLEYPEELHHLHNDYPLTPEKLCVRDDMLSDYCRDIKYKFKISNGRVHKLIPTLNDKERYVLHEKNLELYLSLGLRLKRVHRVLQFKEKPWLKKFIDFNTEKRKEAKNDFEKEFF